MPLLLHFLVPSSTLSLLPFFSLTFFHLLSIFCSTFLHPPPTSPASYFTHPVAISWPSNSLSYTPPLYKYQHPHFIIVLLIVNWYTSTFAMKRGAKGPARSARQGQNTAASNVMLTPTLTQTVVKINQAQSLYIVQTTVSAAFSTILWIYNLFPDDYFESRSYSLDDPTFPYSVKTPAQAVWEGKQGNDKAIVTWDFLLNGKTAQTDKIWLWLVRTLFLTCKPSFTLTRFRTESMTPLSVNTWQVYRSASIMATCPATP